MLLPSLTPLSGTRLVSEVFYGLDRRVRASDGSMSEMKNLSSELYPVLSPRKKRGTVASLGAPTGMSAKDALLYTDGAYLYYNGTQYNLALSPDSEKQIISMGAYAVIFPDKKYFNTADVTDFGSIDSRFNAAQDDTVSYTLCGADETPYVIAVTGTGEPSEPSDGMLWLDTSGSQSTLKQYAAATGVWTGVVSTYIKISCAGLGNAFSQYDGVVLSGITATAVEGLNGANVIHSCGDGYIVVTGIMSGASAAQTGSLSVKREAPDMDFVCEAGNRLWGCKYGISDGRAVNELYCSTLGDFKNWSRYQGISTDSWAAGVGTDGAFTAAVAYQGSPLFFKQDCMHKVYISGEGAHQIQTVSCRGVKSGCYKSVKTVGETLYYLSPSGVCAYDGSLPRVISEPLCKSLSDASAGSLGSKYYISACEGENVYSMYVYDSALGLWHREDDTHALYFAQTDSELFFIDSDNRLSCVTGSTGTLEDNVEFEAVSSTYGYGEPNRKYLSRFNLSMYLPAGSYVNVYIRYDSGEFEYIGRADGRGEATVLLPVVPRRCERLSLKLSGRGEFRLYSVSRILVGGSDAQCL